MKNSRVEDLFEVIESAEDAQIDELKRYLDHEDSVGVLALAKFDISRRVADGDRNPKLKVLLNHITNRLAEVRR